MIRRITLENFMSHRLTTIEPAEGLTVLAGPNNCGKSAVVVALQTLCAEPTGDFMVRHGASRCRVAVETDDGHLVEWIRKGRTASYRIDGREVHRIRGGPPEELHALLRLGEVESPDGKESFDIHFAEQKSPIFLLDRSGRHAALFFASSSDAALLLEMQRRHKDRAAEKKRREVELARTIEARGRSLEILQPVEDLEGAVEGLEEMEGALAGREAAAAELAGLADVLLRLDRSIRRGRDRAEALAALAAPPALADTDRLEALIAAIARQGSLAAKLGERAAALGGLAAPPDLAPVGPLEELCAVLRRRRRQEESAAAKASALEALPEPPALADPAALAALIASVEAAGEAVGEKRAAADAAGAAVDEARAAIEDWARENPICPTCGAAVDPGRLLAAGGAHRHG